MGILRVATGSYTGNNTNNRTITGLGFQPNLVIIKPADTQASVGAWSWPNLGADRSIDPNAGANPFINAIQSFDTDGFTIGTEARVNANGVIFNWAAFYGTSEYFYEGSYTGNATARSITGVGFQPDFIFIKRSTGTNQQGRAAFGSAPTYAFPFSSSNPTTGIIDSFDTDGFSISTISIVNSAGAKFDFFCLKAPTGAGTQTTYTGNGSDNRAITGLGFQPEFMLVKAIAGGQQFVGRNGAMTGDDSIIYAPGQANAADIIQSLDSDGFTVGTAASINTNTRVYHYLALKDYNPSIGNNSAFFAFF